MRNSDEREDQWLTRSYLFAFGAMALISWIGIMGLGGYVIWANLPGQTPSSFNEYPGGPLGIWLLMFGCYLMVLFLLLPTLHASWTMPEIIEDEPEEEDRLRFVRPRRR